MTKQISEQELQRIVNVIDQTRQRIGQHTWDKRPLTIPLQQQIVLALEHVQRTLQQLPDLVEK